MEDSLIFIGTTLEQNTNGELLLWIACCMVVPALFVGFARYAKIIITGEDFKIFQK